MDRDGRDTGCARDADATDEREGEREQWSEKVASSTAHAQRQGVFRFRILHSSFVVFLFLRHQRISLSLSIKQSIYCDLSLSLAGVDYVWGSSSIVKLLEIENG